MIHETGNITIRKPIGTDGPRLYELIENCPPLDANSRYCNLLQCTHFSETSVAAEIQGELVGFISGYLIPDRPDTYFLWQVAVGEMARGRGLATKMIKHILGRPSCSGVLWLETTVTKSNTASWALFKGLASKLQTRLQQSMFFDRDRHFLGKHDSEFLARIGPFNFSELENSQAAAEIITGKNRV